MVAGPQLSVADEPETSRRADRGRISLTGPLRSRRVWGIAAVAATYLFIACMAYWPVAPWDGRHLVGCACSDPVQEAWFLRWPVFALTHGHNPFFTGYLHAPSGANLSVNTSMPLLGLLGWPVTALSSSVATYNLLLRIALAASGLSMFLVMRRYTKWWPAAFASGLLFAFSPFMMGHAWRHLFLIFLPLVPLFLPLIDDWLVTQRRSPARSGIFIGLLAAVQYLISAEVLLLTALFAAVGVATLAARRWSIARQRLGIFARGIGWALLPFILITGYPIWMLIAGPALPIGPPHSVAGLSFFHGDLLTPFLPTRGELISPSVLRATGSAFVTGGIQENGFYLGVPLLCLLGYVAVRLRRMPLVTVSVVIAVVAFVLGLGPTLTVHGHRVFSPLPFAALTHLPVLQDLESARLSLFVQFAAAVLLGLGLDHFRRHLRAPAVAGLALVALIPLTPRLPISSAPTQVPAFFTSSQVRALPQGTLALTYPYDVPPVVNDPMLWQVASGMRFRIFGGEAFVPGPDGRSTTRPLDPLPPELRRLFIQGPRWPLALGPRRIATEISALREFCLLHHVGAILVRPTTPQGQAVTSIVTTALGSPPQTLGGMNVWLDVASRLASPST